MIFYLIAFLLPVFTPLTGADPVEWIGETTVDVGDIPRGEDYLHTFEFRNTSDAPIQVYNVRVGCGCTATDWAETPVAPGAVGKIKVTYDSMSDGYFRKYVKVFFVGHRGGHKLYLEGFVE